MTVMKVLVKTPCSYEYKHNAHQCGYSDRNPFGCNEIEIKHEGHAWRNEKESHVGDEKLTYGGYGTWIDHSSPEQECE